MVDAPFSSFTFPGKSNSQQHKLRYTSLPRSSSFPKSHNSALSCQISCTSSDSCSIETFSDTNFSSVVSTASIRVALSASLSNYKATPFATVAHLAPPLPTSPLSEFLPHAKSGNLSATGFSHRANQSQGRLGAGGFMDASLAKLAEERYYSNQGEARYDRPAGSRRADSLDSTYTFDEMETEVSPAVFAESEPVIKRKLGPTMKILSPAPWNLSEAASSATKLSTDVVSPGAGARTPLGSPTEATGVKARTLHKVQSFGLLRKKISDFKTGGGEPTRGGVPGSTSHSALSSIATTSTSSSRRPSTAASRKDSKSFLDMDEVSLKSYNRPPVPSHHKSATLAGSLSTPSSPPSSFTKKHQVTSRSRSTVALPAGFELVAESMTGMDPSPHSAPPTQADFDRREVSTSGFPSSNSSYPFPPPSIPIDSSKPLFTSPNRSTYLDLTHPASTRPLEISGPDNVQHHNSMQTTFKLISLEEAQTKDRVRAEVAAAHRQAMLPVENIAQKEKPPRESVAVSRGSSSAQDEEEGVKVLKTRKSGFLKRMMGGNQNSLQISDNAEELLETLVESYRALPDDYVMTNGVLPPSGVTFAPPPPLSKKEKPSLPRVTADLNGASGLPSLSLRPISVAFTTGLADFLEDTTTPPLVSRKFSAPPELSPSAPSFYSNTTGDQSSMFDHDSRSAPGTPLTPLFHSPTFEGSRGTKMDVVASILEGGPENFSVLRELYLRDRASWGREKQHLDHQVRGLIAELRSVKEERAPQVTGPVCERCQNREVDDSGNDVSVISRPRFKHAGGGGSLFGSGMAI